MVLSSSGPLNAQRRASWDRDAESKDCHGGYQSLAQLACSQFSHIDADEAGKWPTRVGKGVSDCQLDNVGQPLFGNADMKSSRISLSGSPDR